MSCDRPLLMSLEPLVYGGDILSKEETKLKITFTYCDYIIARLDYIIVVSLHFSHSAYTLYTPHSHIGLHCVHIIGK